MEEALYDGRLVNVSEIIKIRDIKDNNTEYTNVRNKIYTCPECECNVHYKDGIHPNFAHYPIESLSPENRLKQRSCDLWFDSSHLNHKKENADIKIKVKDIQIILDENNICGYTVLSYADVNTINELSEKYPNNNFIVVEKNMYLKEFLCEDGLFGYKKHSPKLLNGIEVIDKTPTVRYIFANDRISIGAYLYIDGFYILKRYEDNNNFVTPYKISLNELVTINELLKDSKLTNIQTYDNKIKSYNDKVKEFADKIKEHNDILNGRKSFEPSDILSEDEIILENKYNEELNIFTSTKIRKFVIEFDYNKHGSTIINIIKEHVSKLKPSTDYIEFDNVTKIYKKYNIEIDKFWKYNLRGKIGIWNNEKCDIKILTLENEFNGTKLNEIENQSILKFIGESDVFYNELVKKCENLHFTNYEEKEIFNFGCVELKERIYNLKQNLYKKSLDRKILEETDKLKEYKNINKISNLEKKVIEFLDVNEYYREKLDKKNELKLRRNLNERIYSR